MENVRLQGFQSLLFEASAVGFVGEGLEVERRAVVRCGPQSVAVEQLHDAPCHGRRRVDVYKRQM